MQSILNTLGLAGLAVGIHFFIKGLSPVFHEKDHELSQTFRNVALIKDSSFIGNLSKKNQVVSIARGKKEAAEAEIVELERTNYDTTQWRYVRNSIDKLYESRGNDLLSNQNDLIKKVDENEEILILTLDILKNWLISAEKSDNHREYELLKILSFFPKDETISALKLSLAAREERGFDNINSDINHKIYKTIGELSDHQNDQSDFMIAQGDPALLGLIQYSNSLHQSNIELDKDIERKVNEHLLDTFHYEIENAGRERRKFWLEAFASSSNPQFRQLYLDARND